MNVKHVVAVSPGKLALTGIVTVGHTIKASISDVCSADTTKVVLEGYVRETISDILYFHCVSCKNRRDQTMATALYLRSLILGFCLASVLTSTSGACILE